MTDLLKNTICPREIKPFIDPVMVEKSFDELEDYDINYLIALSQGKMVAIHDYNDIYCKSVHERVDFTVIDDDGTRWVISTDLDFGSIHKTTRTLDSNLFRTYLKSIDIDDDGYATVTVEKKYPPANKVTLRGKGIEKTFANALVRLLYSEPLSVMVPIRDRCLSSSLNIKGRKPVGITEREFYR